MAMFSVTSISSAKDARISKTMRQLSQSIKHLSKCTAKFINLEKKMFSNQKEKLYVNWNSKSRDPIQ